MITAEGGLAGPFNAFVTAPDAGQRMSALGATLRFGTSIERRLTEVAIITIGARWQAEFEWWAHARMAREHGVPEAVVAAIGRGEQPSFDAAQFLILNIAIGGDWGGQHGVDDSIFPVRMDIDYVRVYQR